MTEAAHGGPAAGGWAAVYEAYRRLNDAIEWVVIAVTAAIVGVIVMLPFIGVVVRWITGEGYSFLAETAPQLVPWVVFPMIGVLLRRDGHIAVDMVPHFLQGGAATALRVAVLGLCAVATAAMGWFGVRTTTFFANLGQLSTTEIEFPLWYLYVSYPVGMLLAANFCLESLIGEASGRRRRRQAEVL
ncbi:MAG: TRAP transporter small permease [Burkholderiaceae bacterium]